MEVVVAKYSIMFLGHQLKCVEVDGHVYWPLDDLMDIMNHSHLAKSSFAICRSRAIQQISKKSFVREFLDGGIKIFYIPPLLGIVEIANTEALYSRPDVMKALDFCRC